MQDSGGPTIGGYHIPDPTKIFRHHPARPPPGAPPASSPVPPGTAAGYFKYFSAGAICATITHVLVLLALIAGHGDAN
jgi:hypothetical protein